SIRARWRSCWMFWKTRRRNEGGGGKEMSDSGLAIEELVELRNAVRSRLTWDDAISDEDLRRLIEDELFRRERARRMTAGERKAAVMRLFHSFRGLDALQPL